MMLLAEVEASIFFWGGGDGEVGRYELGLSCKPEVSCPWGNFWQLTQIQFPGQWVLTAVHHEFHSECMSSSTSVCLPAPCRSDLVLVLTVAGNTGNVPDTAVWDSQEGTGRAIISLAPSLPTFSFSAITQPSFQKPWKSCLPLAMCWSTHQGVPSFTPHTHQGYFHKQVKFLLVPSLKPILVKKFFFFFILSDYTYFHLWSVFKCYVYWFSSLYICHHCCYY